MKIEWIFLLGIIAPSAQAKTFSFGTEPEAYSLEVLESDLHHTVLEFTLHRFDANQILINQMPYQILSVEGAGILTQKGLPLLPKVYRHVEIGASDSVQVKVREEEHETFSLGNVAPSKGSLLRNLDPQKVEYTFDDFYRGKGKRGTFPDATVSLSAPFQFRKTHGVTVQIHPFSFSPQSHETLVYTRLVVEVTAQGVRENKAADTRDTDAFDFLYQNQFINHQRIDSASMRSDKAKSVREQGDLLIISHPNFTAGLTPFIDWKMQMGFSTKLVTLPQTGKTAGAIKAYIKSAYANNPKLAYVLLVGDAEYVPFYPGTAGNAYKNEADPLYGVFNSSGYPDLIIARFSVKNTTDLANMINRSIAYEKTPTDGDWYQHAVGIASAEGEPTDGARADYERNALLAGPYKEVDQLYDPNVDASDVASAINNGASLVNYIGHGSETAWMTGYFTTYGVNTLSNAGKLPMVISVACVNGRFSYTGGDSFAERWMKAGTPSNPVGAIAIMASSTNQAWVPPTIGQLAISKLVANGTVTHIGALMMDGSLAVLEDGSLDAAQTFQTWHIFGDPTVTMRIHTPKALAIIPAFSMGLASGVKLNVKESNLRVTLTADHQLLGSAVSTAGGDVAFPSLSLSHGKMVTVTVNGVDRIPLVKTIQVP